MLTLGLTLTHRLAVVIGGGKVAARKVGVLLEAGARVRVISPRLTPELSSLREQGRIEVLQRPFAPGDTEGAMLVVAATGHREVDAAIAAEATAGQRLVCVSGAPDLGNVAFTATVHRGPVQIAISTAGSSPALARRLRRELEQTVGREYGLLAQWLEAVREQVRQAPGRTDAQRAALFTAIVQGPALGLLAKGEEEAARVTVQAMVQEFLAGSQCRGGDTR